MKTTLKIASLEHIFISEITEDTVFVWIDEINIFLIYDEFNGVYHF